MKVNAGSMSGLPSERSSAIPTTSRATKPAYVFLAGFAAAFAVLTMAEYIGYSKITASWNHADYIAAVKLLFGVVAGCITGNYIGRKIAIWEANRAQHRH